VLDGSGRLDDIIRSSMSWDVMGGCARRAWARNEHAIEVSGEFNGKHPDQHITLPHIADERLLRNLVGRSGR